MKVVLLAGGYGTRISEMTDVRPKPMVEIGGRPILWHIMKLYSSFGFNDFLFCLGYKGYVIKEYFYHYALHHSDVTIDMAGNNVELHNSTSEPWTVRLIDTGIDTMTGGRLKRIEPYINESAFLMTYGDGVSDVNIAKTVEFHRSHDKQATMTVVQPPGRFGAVDLTESQNVTRFMEKPRGDQAWINGGFFVLSRDVFKFISQGDETVFEREPLENLAREGELMAYQHDGFWHSMDTLRDKNHLETLWSEGNPPWKVWAA